LRRRIEAVAGYYDSMSKLDRSEETTRAGEAILKRAVNRPEWGTPIRGYRIRMMQTTRIGPFPPLRLLYALDDDTMYLLWIGVVEELAL